jgi:hypothetical protein
MAPAPAQVSRHFERDPIPYALETDWPVGAAGFEPLHLGLQLAQDSQPGREDSNLCILESGSQLGGPGPELAYLELYQPSQ